jgi:hypothetical protein
MDPLFVPEFLLDTSGLKASLQNSAVLGLKDAILQKVG